MFIRVLLPEPQRIVSGVFDCSRNVLVQIGIHETLTEAENGFRLLEGIPADSPTVVGHWPFTTLAGSGGQDLDTLNHFDHCCEVIDGQVRLVSGISASDINHWPGDYQVSVPGTLALAFRDYYGSEIDEELQIAFVVLTPSFAAITVYDRRKLSYYSWEDCGDSLESLQEAIEFLFRGDWRHNLQRIVVVGWHPAATGIKWDLVQSGAVRSEFDGKRAFGEDVQFRELNGCTNQIGSPFHHSAYPALLFAAGRLAALGFGPDFGGKLASQPPAQKPTLKDRFHQGLLNGVVARVGRGGVSAGLGIGLMLLLLLLPVEYYWYTSEKNTLTQANQHEDENLVKNEDVANKVKILEQHINDVNLIRDATNTLIQGQKTNLQVLTSLYICATAKQGLVLSRVESKGRQLVGTGLVDMGGILAAQSPGSTASPQPPVQKEKPVSDLIADMRQSGDFDPEITFSFTNNQHGDQAEFTIYARYAKHVEVPSLDKLVVPRLVEPYRNLTSTPTQTAQK